MASKNTVLDSGVVEVPPELRGPSNEEILQNEGREDTALRRRAAARPSKRERERRKLGLPAPAKPASAGQKPQSKGFSAKAAPGREAPAHAGSRLSVARKKLESLFNAVTRRQAEPAPVHVEPKPEPPKAAAPAVPPSGRVLRGAFGAKPSDTARAQVFSASELARIRMEERAKKIRAELARKSGPGPLIDENGQPVKRPRGRPRKNPMA